MTKKFYCLASFVVKDRPHQYEPLYKIIHEVSGGKARVIEDGAVLIGGYAQFSLVLECDSQTVQIDMCSKIPDGLSALGGTLADIDCLKVRRVDEETLSKEAPWEVDLSLEMSPNPANFSWLADCFREFGLSVQRTSGWIVEDDDPEAEYPQKYETVYTLIPKSSEVKQLDMGRFVQRLSAMPQPKAETAAESLPDEKLKHKPITVISLDQRLRIGRARRTPPGFGTLGLR